MQSLRGWRFSQGAFSMCGASAHTNTWYQPFVLLFLLILQVFCFFSFLFPLNSDTAQRRLCESSLFLQGRGEKSAGRFVSYLNDSGSFNWLISAHFVRLFIAHLIRLEFHNELMKAASRKDPALRGKSKVFIQKISSFEFMVWQFVTDQYLHILKKNTRLCMLSPPVFFHRP